MSLVCPECGESRRRNLCAHLFSVHGYSKEDIGEFKLEQRKSKVLSKSETPLEYDFCGLTYSSNNTLVKHLREKHSEVSSGNWQLKVAPSTR